METKETVTRMDDMYHKNTERNTKRQNDEANQADETS